MAQEEVKLAKDAAVDVAHEAAAKPFGLGGRIDGLRLGALLRRRLLESAEASLKAVSDRQRQQRQMMGPAPQQQQQPDQQKSQLPPLAPRAPSQSSSATTRNQQSRGHVT